MAFPEDAVCKFRLAEPSRGRITVAGYRAVYRRAAVGGGVKSQNVQISICSPRVVPRGVYSEVPIEETNFAKYHSVKTRLNALTINILMSTISLVRTVDNLCIVYRNNRFYVLYNVEYSYIV